MLRNGIASPWQIEDSESEDETMNSSQLHASVSSSPTTSGLNGIRLGKRVEPRVLDWYAAENEVKTKAKFRSKKTAPSSERAPSSSKPIFSGPLIVNSSASPSRSLSLQNDTEAAHNIPELPSIATKPNFNSFECIEEDLAKFVYSCAPKDHPGFVHCYLRRDKSGIQQGFLPTYYLSVVRPSDSKKILVLVARRVARLNRHAEYTVSTNVETLSQKSQGDGYVGKLRANNINGTQYTLFDNGLSPNTKKYSVSAKNRDLRRELIAVMYGPREFQAVMPQPDHDVRPAKHEPSLIDRWHARRFTHLIQLRNREPLKNEKKRRRSLNFNCADDIQPSVKNFQIVIDDENQEEEMIMQFGRISDDTFLCEYRYPLSAIQAFGIALCTFDTRLT